MNRIKFESALIIPVQEAEPLVGSYRERYDPSAAAGMVAHVTLLYPFAPPSLITDDLIDKLRGLIARFDQLELEFEEICTFPDTLYLAPEPRTRLVAIMQALFDAFPDYPPYGGIFPEVIPHLTVAQSENTQELELLAEQFETDAAGHLPIESIVQSVDLWDNSSGLWRLREQLELAS